MSKPEDDFLTAAEIQDAATSYRTVATHRLENRICFDSAESVLAWWRNHNSFAPSVATDVEQFLSEHFEINETFTLTKNALGVRFDV